jgi:hypothetical protein
MRLAYEIGYSTAILFSGRTMRFLSLDSTTFKLPVPVGSILRLTSTVAHTIPGCEGSEYGTLVVSMFSGATRLADSILILRDHDRLFVGPFFFILERACPGRRDRR